jgi:hypothetical protein
MARVSIWLVICGMTAILVGGVTVLLMHSPKLGVPLAILGFSAIAFGQAFRMFSKAQL